MKFTAVVGNPPYSESLGKTETQAQSNTSWVYQYFQFAADKLSRYTSLIYPFGGWFDSPNSLSGLGNKILKDGHTISIDAYESTTDKRAWYRTDKEPKPIFNNSANLSAGVSIVFRDHTKKTKYIKYSNRIYTDNTAEIDIKNTDSLAPNPNFININKKLPKTKLKTRMTKGIFGIESDFVEKNPSKVSTKKSDWKNPIQLLTNDKSGPTGRAKIFWTDKANIPKGASYFNYFKVVTTSAYPKKSFVSSNPTVTSVQQRIKELIELLPNNSAFGRSRMAIFMSKNEKECKNFIKYTQTKFFASLMIQEPNRSSVFGYIIPDQDFTDNSDIKWDSSLEKIDKQLFDKYNITAEEQKLLGINS